jgi:hypothetical protein
MKNSLIKLRYSSKQIFENPAVNLNPFRTSCGKIACSSSELTFKFLLCGWQRLEGERAIRGLNFTSIQKQFVV